MLQFIRQSFLTNHSDSRRDTGLRATLTYFFQCPDSASKKDLLAYLQRIALYCQQLNITSKVKADVQNVSGELIVSGCPDSASKKDLVAYLQRITLYCQQLNITSKVKNDITSVSGQAIVVTGLDSATSLIMAAKNLMNAVVLTVKACYVASTKYKQAGHTSTVVMWKMKPPEKKALVKREDPNELRSKVRKGARKKNMEPVKALSEFQEIDSFC